MKTVIVVASFAVVLGLAVSQWVRGWRSQIRAERASAVVHDLERSGVA